MSNQTKEPVCYDCSLSIRADEDRWPPSTVKNCTRWRHINHELCNVRLLEEVETQSARLARIRDLVTTDHESKEQFIARVRAVLDGADLTPENCCAPIKRSFSAIELLQLYREFLIAQYGPPKEMTEDLLREFHTRVGLMFHFVYDVYGAV